MRITTTHILAGLILAVMATGCAPQLYTPPDYSEYFWPKPPPKKRVQLLKMIRTDIDIRKPTAGELLFGESAFFAFKKPGDVVVDDNGNIFVSDSYLNSIYKLDLASGSIMTFGPAGKWSRPGSLAIDNKNGLLGIMAGGSPFVFSLAQGKPAFTLSGVSFKKPVGIAFDPDNKLVYVSDIKGHMIHQFDYTGKHLKTFGVRGSAEGSLYFPGHMAVDKEGLLYVVDIMHWLIKVFDKEGAFVRSFGGHGSGPGQFARPKGIAISRDGIVMVTDGDFNRVTLFNSTGAPLLIIGSAGSGPGQFINPYGIFVDQDNKVYVVDQSNRRIHVYQLYTDEYYDREFKKEVTATPDPISNLAKPGDENAPEATVGGQDKNVPEAIVEGQEVTATPEPTSNLAEPGDENAPKPTVEGQEVTATPEPASNLAKPEDENAPKPTVEGQ